MQLQKVAECSRKSWDFLCYRGMPERKWYLNVSSIMKNGQSWKTICSVWAKTASSSVMYLNLFTRMCDVNKKKISLTLSGSRKFLSKNEWLLKMRTLIFREKINWRMMLRIYIFVMIDNERRLLSNERCHIVDRLILNDFLCFCNMTRR